MGWMRMFLLGNIGQQLDLDAQAAELQRLREQATTHRRAFERSDHQLDELRDEHEQLKAGVATLVRSLLAKNLISREEVRQITDLADPSADA